MTRIYGELETLKILEEYAKVYGCVEYGNAMNLHFMESTFLSLYQDVLINVDMFLALSQIITFLNS